MNRLIATIAITLIIVTAISIGNVAYAKKNKVSLYEVTITNITRGQIISPPIVISHNHKFNLFILGDQEKPASPGLAALAEDANTAVLADELDATGSVYDYNEASGPIVPGSSITIRIKTKRGFQRISAAGMLVTSNDAFFAVRGVYARSWTKVLVDAKAYDSGTERNSENCDYIPGPPCENGGVRDTAGAEGYVYVHSGIHGIGDLEPADFDWRNPVATIMVRRVK